MENNDETKNEKSVPSFYGPIIFLSHHYAGCGHYGWRARLEFMNGCDEPGALKGNIFTRRAEADPYLACIYVVNAAIAMGMNLDPFLDLNQNTLVYDSNAGGSHPENWQSVSTMTKFKVAGFVKTKVKSSSAPGQEGIGELPPELVQFLKSKGLSIVKVTKSKHLPDIPGNPSNN